MSVEQQQTNSNGADKKSFNIRVPQTIALRIEEQALSLATAPTTLIQSIIVRHFESESRVGETESAAQTAMLMKLEAIRKLCDLIEQTESKRYGQMLFEIVKTRSAVFHSIDQTPGGAAIDSIMDACAEAARQYIAQLSTETEERR
jgi:ABC-type enterochelin transport system permease subunit